MLAILAGSNGLVGQSESTGTLTTASVHDVDETTDTPDGTLPPGLTGAGVLETDAFARTHVDTLPNQSNTLDARTTFAGNVSNQRPRRYAYRQTSPGSWANTTKFAGGEVTYTRYYRVAERLQRAPRRTDSGQYGLFAAGAIECYLAVENVIVAEFASTRRFTIGSGQMPTATTRSTVRETTTSRRRSPRSASCAN